MKRSLLVALIFTSFFAKSQTNVRAWQAQGQVWVVWQTALPLPETFAIFKKNTAFTNTAQATPIGRLFHYEYLPGTFAEQTNDPNFTYRIPKPDGSMYQLLPGEGLFVETVTGSGSAFYAVVEWGKTAVTAGVNITQNAVSFNYNPVAQPVNCHLQTTSVGSLGHKSAWFAVWVLGKTEHWAGRPDFPVMANAAKNGMPAMFIVSQALDLDTAAGKKIPMTHWMHGGGMYASQFLPAGFKVFNTAPEQGISVSHNDDFPILTITESGDSVFTAGRSVWFGWTKNHDPFSYGFAAGPGDTVINYTQRRVMWINDWLIKHLPIDPDRVAVQGYSMGSGGATGLAKAFPDRFSTASLFNCGLRGGVDPTSIAMVGSATDNLPTNLRGFNGEVMRVNDIFKLNSRLSGARDLPIFRIWNGKNDPNDRMHWGPDMVAQIREADSLGWGIQFQWDERPHTYPILGMHWIHDFGAANQTYLDDLRFQENFNSKQSFPAFFNHRLDPKNNDPGIGMFGIDNGDGDNWGTWGGYHRWENTAEISAGWQTIAWLESNAVFANDNCPENSLLADLAIRKPQVFKPLTGKNLNWNVKDAASGQILQSGQTTVQADDLVVIPQVEVFRESIRKVRISIFDPTVSAGEADGFSAIEIFPNPTDGLIFLKKGVERARVFDLNGRQMFEKAVFEKEELDVSALPAGVYFLEILNANNLRQIGRFVKI